MKDNRTNKLFFNFCFDKAARTRLKILCFRVAEILKSYDLSSYTCIENGICKQTLATCSCIKRAVISVNGSGNGGNKLRTCNLQN